MTLSAPVMSPPPPAPRRFCSAMIVALAALVAIAPARLAAQGCPAGTSRTLASALHGHRIGAVRVVTADPVRPPGAPDAVENLHVRTRAEIVRRNLLFSAGDTVDTLRVAESLRRLRRLRILADVAIVATTCAGSDTTDLTVLTRDAWSTEPSVKVRGSGSAVVGFEERNLLGTGRDAKVYLRSDGGQLAFGMAYTDPWVAHTNLAASVGRDAYRDGGDLRGTVGLRERSIFDRWRGGIALARSAREAPSVVGDTVRREAASLLIGRRVTTSRTGATSVLAGFEYSEARVTAGARAAIVGPSAVRREFAGIDVGIAQQTARYGVVDWYLPGGAPLELPVAFEGEAVFGVGRDIAFGLPAQHADAWVGRYWTKRDLLLSADGWASGYRIGNQVSAASVRLALGIDAPAMRGRWSGRFAAEQLSDPDPDVRALASIDPTLTALPERARLAETAVSTSVERDVHLRRLTRSYMLDAAIFGAASMRWDPAAGGERPSVGALGVGLRLTPARVGLASVGISAGFPLARSAGVPSRPFIAFTISPWLESGRTRDGCRQR